MFIRKQLLLILLFFSFNLFAVEKGPKLGQLPSPEMVKQWNVDVFPNGEGLPEGQGTANLGIVVYEKYCISCHGLDGTGDSADELAGAMHALTDSPPDKTIRTYWPYATTIFDFTRRSMPLNSPGTLNNNELYAVTAYLLYLNGIIEKDNVINADTLPKVIMPNRNGFINIYEKETAND